MKKFKTLDIKKYGYAVLSVLAFVYAGISAYLAFVEHSSMPNACIEEVITSLCFCLLFAYLTVRRVLKGRKNQNF